MADIRSISDDHHWLANVTPGTPLDALMDNVAAGRIAAAMHRAMTDHAGDQIDRGLAILHRLNEIGLDLVPRVAP